MPVLKLIFTCLFKKRYSAASNICTALYICSWVLGGQLNKSIVYFISLFVIFTASLFIVSIIEDVLKIVEDMSK